MGNWFRNFFAGRNGPDTLGKTQLLLGVIFMPAAYLLAGVWGGYLSFFLNIASFVLILMSLIRVMSRNIYLRQMQNARFTGFFRRLGVGLRIHREHFQQRKTWKFYRCPQCKTWLRVPAGKGKVHISCKCGYMLYRKT